MLLDRIFPNLRKDKPGIYWQSKVMDFYGRHFLGGPTIDQIPGPDKALRQFLAERYYHLVVDRTPKKRSPYHKHSAIWVENLRQHEHPRVAVGVFFGSVILCTILFGMGVGIKKASGGMERWFAKREAAAQVEEAREYANKREALMKKWAVDIADYSAQKCLDEITALRTRTSAEDRDHYVALETGCDTKRQEIAAIAAAWSAAQCADFVNAGTAELKKGGVVTWTDQVIYRNCTHHGDAFQALMK